MFPRLIITEPEESITDCFIDIVFFFTPDEGTKAYIAILQ